MCTIVTTAITSFTLVPLGLHGLRWRYLECDKNRFHIPFLGRCAGAHRPDPRGRAQPHYIMSHWCQFTTFHVSESFPNAGGIKIHFGKFQTLVAVYHDVLWPLNTTLNNSEAAQKAYN